MATVDSSGVIALFGQTQSETDSDAPLTEQADAVLEQRLNLAYEANARALELIEALRPYIDQSSAIELPTLLFNRLSQLCHVAYDATGGGDLHISGSGIDDLRKIVDANLLYPDETS